MKHLMNTRIEYHTSTYNEWAHCYSTDDYVNTYSGSKTISELFTEAQNTLSECTYGIARIYYGKYQIGTVTKKNYADVNIFYTDFGKRLSGS